jgi:RecT family protein
VNAIIPVAANALVPHDMDQAIRLAQAMASAKMVPKHLQGDTGTCLMVVEQAMRWGMSPFAVAQCTSSIGGKLMYEGKLVAAAVEGSGAIEGRFDYEWAGEGENRQITVSARRRGETNPRQMTIHLKDVRTSNEWWKKQPDQMLVYSGTRNWARRWTPAVILGVYAPEEFDRAAGKVVEPFNGTTIEAEPEQPPTALGEREAINAATPMPEPPQPEKRSWAQWADSLEMAVRDAKSNDELGKLLAKAEVAEIKRLAEQGAYHPTKARILNAIADAERRYLADPPDAEDEAPEIKGEANIMAG